mgnify:FL=1
MKYLDISTAAQTAGISGKTYLAFELLNKYAEISPQLGRNVVGVILRMLTVELSRARGSNGVIWSELKFQVGLMDKIRSVPVQVPIEVIRDRSDQNTLLIRNAPPKTKV